MPYLQLITNVQLDDERKMDLVKSLSKVAATALKKPEEYMSVSYEYNSTLIFAGTSEPCFQIGLISIGLTPQACPDVSASIAAELKSKLGVDPSRGYMNLQDPTAGRIGYAETTFAQLK
ncbi:hypothetical protein M408DRAFT_332523 [Serendipita vermifera MAFF 305830]|uniref:L-dopachrome isomerase n=1 Tax=Serendipita vermifera MAFF 305830 TaxID=933852 RepID=A0A0C2X0J3_SERVB|nr:hypothetical protein M408DRAFT_334105 [Serendipita vermifera MAFF 305830]KIM23042.1 hypothetical protein M408DRAFT_332523 [Serendipita vermifera MAFF 305830]